MKTRKPGTFQKGNRASVGNKGGGRPPEWLAAQCREIIEKKKLIPWLGRVAAGEEPMAEMKDRIKAYELLCDRAWGKAAQPIEGIGGEGIGVIIIRNPGENSCAK